MGWLGKLIDGAASQEAKSFTFLRGLGDPGLSVSGKPIAPDETYVEIYLEALSLKFARKFTTSFHGVVYAYASLARDGDETADFAAVTKPERLAQLDPNNLDRVITISKHLFGPIPWRGGSLGLELGLFSVKQSNLMTGVLDLVGKIADSVGVSFVTSAKPFLPLIRQGMDLVAGQVEDCALEVAIDTNLILSEGELFAIISVPNGTLNRAELSIDRDSRALLKNGTPLQEAYCVFSVRAIGQKADFGQIPALKTAYATFSKAVVDGDVEAAKRALGQFERTALVSPDLIPADRERIVEKVRYQFNSAFPSGPKPVGRKEVRSVPRTLDALKLYD